MMRPVAIFHLGHVGTCTSFYLGFLHEVVFLGARLPFWPGETSRERRLLSLLEVGARLVTDQESGEWHCILPLFCWPGPRNRGSGDATSFDKTSSIQHNTLIIVLFRSDPKGIPELFPTILSDQSWRCVPVGSNCWQISQYHSTHSSYSNFSQSRNHWQLLELVRVRFCTFQHKKTKHN